MLFLYTYIMEDKIKSLLDSPSEKNQRLGIQLAMSVLKWNPVDIGRYVFESSKNYNPTIAPCALHSLVNVGYHKTFCGFEFEIYYKHEKFVVDDLSDNDQSTKTVLGVAIKVNYQTYLVNRGFIFYESTGQDYHNWEYGHFIQRILEDEINNN